MIDKMKNFAKTKLAVFIEILIILVCVFSLYCLHKPEVEEPTTTPIVNWDTETLDEKVPGYRYNRNHRHKSEVIPDGLMLDISNMLKKEDCWWYGVETCIETALRTELEFNYLSIRTNNVEEDNTSYFDIYEHKSIEYAKEWYDYMLEFDPDFWTTSTDTISIVIPENMEAQGHFIILIDNYVIKSTCQNKEHFDKYTKLFSDLLDISIL